MVDLDTFADQLVGAPVAGRQGLGAQVVRIGFDIVGRPVGQRFKLLAAEHSLQFVGDGAGDF